MGCSHTWATSTLPGASLQLLFQVVDRGALRNARHVPGLQGELEVQSTLLLPLLPHELCMRVSELLVNDYNYYDYYYY